MARNEEKANSMLNKWVTMKEGMARGDGGRRPFLASECDDLTAALRWRREILREMARKINEIQNAGLGEHRLRDLNDEINKLIRERRHWERRIRELGGQDFSRQSNAMEREGVAPRGGRGYLYFGATKNLPGVRELFEAIVPPKAKRTRAELYRNVTPDYYGYRDEDDGTLLLLEAEAEQNARAEAVEEWRQAETARKKQRLLRRTAAASGTIVAKAGGEAGSDSEDDEAGSGGGAAPVSQFKSLVEVPSQEDMNKALLEKKKAMLLSKYTSKGQQERQAKTRQMMNIVS